MSSCGAPASRFLNSLPLLGTGVPFAADAAQGLHVCNGALLSWKWLIYGRVMMSDGYLMVTFLVNLWLSDSSSMVDEWRICDGWLIVIFD